MPMYEYRCNACGESYEKLRRMLDADRNLECPHCGAGDVERQVSCFATAGPSASSGGCGPSTGGSGFS
ncbi:MAG: zinc ribbon domain-containing protein [bacterium]|nr:zinc ribbon domain-containing protein [bacterium]